MTAKTGRGMGKRESTIQPVKALAETGTALEAAVLECLDKPRKTAVHKVRTTTRRIEAQLNLLAMVGGFPPYEDEAAKLGRLLKKLRRAAGAVRDFDVQRDLLAKETEGLPPKAAKEGRRLRRTLKRRRDEEAERLEALLKDIHAKLPRRISALVDVLKPAEAIAVTEVKLTDLVREWYRREVGPLGNAGTHDPDRLHGVRKVAKLARYLAETAPKDAKRAHALADQFETVQESGGQWHDWMILSEVAASELGEAAALPQRFSVHAAEALDDFRKKLGYEV